MIGIFFAQLSFRLEWYTCKMPLKGKVGSHWVPGAGGCWWCGNYYLEILKQVSPIFVAVASQGILDSKGESTSVLIQSFVNID